ncbi:MAG: hypothetical protein U0638_01220 [Phycisphaerales bacterium]
MRSNTGIRVIDAIGHVGAWAGAYCAAATACFVQLAGLGDTPDVPLLLSVFLAATGAYAIDRVKLRDAWIDPADIEAQPERYAFLRTHARSVRFSALLAIAMAGVIGLSISAWAPLASVMAAAGVIVYAPRPRTHRSRVKDVPWLKNLYVAAGISVFAALAGLAAHTRHEVRSIVALLTALAAPGVIATLTILMARVLVDAALCDLDDEASDARHGTRTFVTLLGPQRLWMLSGLIRLGLIGLTLAAWPCPWRARLVWGGAMIAGTLAVRVRRPRELRDVVDVRFAGEAVLATLAFRWLAG